MNTLEISESCKLINQHFDLQNQVLLPKDIDSLEELKTALRKVISYLLDKEFERLLQIMYRIDVPEEKFNHAFQEKGNIAEKITDLVIERELQKVQTRIKYRNF